MKEFYPDLDIEVAWIDPNFEIELAEIKRIERLMKSMNNVCQAAIEFCKKIETLFEPYPTLPPCSIEKVVFEFLEKNGTEKQ